ncbi:hypothetical protein BC826DRAFT_432624 [Russula brevipes]|nr:hypothetical protein BC826DRAFT_432624 [Russula brevipes]
MSSHNCIRKAVQSLVAFLPNIIAQCLFPNVKRTHGPSEDLQMRLTRSQEELDGPRGLCQATIDKLPDEVLLDIFDVYLNVIGPSIFEKTNRWHTLVHVCRRWRDLVFASPRRLDLRLLCTRHKRVREMLDIWPAIPIEIEGDWEHSHEAGPDNIIAALEHSDRVCSIHLHQYPSSVGEALATAVRSFPELTYLWLCPNEGSPPVLPLPDSFLGGSTPRLRTLQLMGVLFPALPNLVCLRVTLSTFRIFLIRDISYPRRWLPAYLL